MIMSVSRPTLRSVEIGARTPQFAEVVSGLAAGERVITHPGDKVADGARVVQRGTSD